MWQIFDQLTEGTSNLPNYRHALSGAEQDRLIDNGWRLEIRARLVRNNTSGNCAFMGWGMSSASSKTSVPRRVGFSFRIGPDNDFIVSDHDGNEVSAGPDSADEYQTLYAGNRPGETRYQWSLNGVFGAEPDLFGNSTGGISTGNAAFQAAQSSPTGSVFNLSRFVLSEGPQFVHVDQSLAEEPPGSKSRFRDDGTSWQDAFSSLRDGLAAAIPGDRILVAEGLYHPGDTRDATFTVKAGVDVLGGYRVTRDIVGGIPVVTDSGRSVGENITTLSGEIGGPGLDDNCYHVVTVPAFSEETVIEGFTISGGSATGSFPDDRGGGMYCEADGLVVSQVRFKGNKSSWAGAGIALSGASPLITHCIFRNNDGGSNAGGVYANVGSSPVVAFSLFSGNLASFGPVIAANSQSTPSLINVTAVGNHARGKGAFARISNQTDLEVVNSIIWGNDAAGAPDPGNSAEIFRDGDSSASFRLSLLQNSGGTDNWNPLAGADLGDNLDVAPRFVAPIQASAAPSMAGDYRLFPRSPAIDQGDLGARPADRADIDVNGNRSEPVSLGLGRRPIGEALNLGAYEEVVPFRFHLLFPGLDPSADDNGNGASNFADYATGRDPRDPSPPSSSLLNLDSETGDLMLSYDRRTDTSDLFVRLQYSPTLTDDWEVIAETIGYETDSTVRSGDGSLETITLRLLPDGDETRGFWRVEYGSPD